MNGTVDDDEVMAYQCPLLAYGLEHYGFAGCEVNNRNELYEKQLYNFIPLDIT